MDCSKTWSTVLHKNFSFSIKKTYLLIPQWKESKICGLMLLLVHLIRPSNNKPLQRGRCKPNVRYSKCQTVVLEPSWRDESAECTKTAVNQHGFAHRRASSRWKWAVWSLIYSHSLARVNDRSQNMPEDKWEQRRERGTQWANPGAMAHNKSPPNSCNH